MRGAGVALALVASVALLGATGCASGPYAEPVTPTGAEWTRARAWLGELRGSEADHPYVVEMRVALRERLTGRGFDARGALAVAPHRALRLILLGPGGSTAVDLWITPTRFRLQVPSLDYVRRGGTDVASMRGLPIAFLRDAFLDPVGGRLLTAHLGQDRRELVVQKDNGAATFEIVAQGEGPLHLIVRRPGRPATRIDWSTTSFQPRAGTTLRYREGTLPGIDLALRIDGVGRDEPDPDAFVDPDGHEVSL